MSYSIDSMLILGVKTHLTQDEEGIYSLPDGTPTFDLANLSDYPYLNEDNSKDLPPKVKQALGTVGPLSQDNEEDVFVIGYLLHHRGTLNLMPQPINLQQLSNNVRDLSQRVLEEINQHGFKFKPEDILLYHAIDNELWHL